MHVCVYTKYQYTMINREGILIYRYGAFTHDTLNSYAAKRMTYPQTRIWIPTLTEKNRTLYVLMICSHCRVAACEAAIAANRHRTCF